MRIDSDHPFFTPINIKLARIEAELQRAEMAAAAWRDHEGPIREVSESKRSRAAAGRRSQPKRSWNESPRQ